MNFFDRALMPLAKKSPVFPTVPWDKVKILSSVNSVFDIQLGSIAQ